MLMEDLELNFGAIILFLEKRGSYLIYLHCNDLKLA